MTHSKDEFKRKILTKKRVQLEIQKVRERLEKDPEDIELHESLSSLYKQYRTT